jgi:hypothetical protein
VLIMMCDMTVGSNSGEAETRKKGILCFHVIGTSNIKNFFIPNHR